MVNALNRIRIARGWRLLLPCVAMTFGTGCAARVYSGSAPAGAYPAPVEDDAIVYVDTVPPNIEAYPHYAYDGGDAYYVEGRWYRRGPRGWGYYRQEPPQLARQRPFVVEQARAPGVPQERSDAAPRERPHEPQAPAHDAPHERSDAERAPAAPRERPHEDKAPAASRPHQGEAEAQPHPGDAARRARPDDTRPAPPKEHEH